MITIEQCPSCGGDPSQRWPAITAPFIAEYALKGPVLLCSLLECGECGLRFFDGRFETHEMKLLYGNYRGTSYFRARHRHEFWYSKHHNEGTGHALPIVKARRFVTEQFLKDHLDTKMIHRVLDYGGDSGQFIPESIGHTKEVFELSDAKPVHGVRRISNEDQLALGSYDLVLLNHVLEHAPSPGELLHKVARLLKPGTGILHIEVPLEHYSLRWARSGPRETARLTRLSIQPRRLRWLDFYSTLSRVLLNSIPPFGILKLHEHINLFDAKTLEKACQAAGLEVIAVESTKTTEGRVVKALSRRSDKPAMAVDKDAPN